MKKGSITWPEDAIQPTDHAINECFCFTLWNAHGERLPKYPHLFCDEPDMDDDSLEDKEGRWPYHYTFYDPNIRQQFPALLGFMMEEILARMNWQYMGDDEYFDYLPGYIDSFTQLHTLLQAHDLWNIFRERAMKTKFAEDDGSLEEVMWCLPEELPSI